MNTPPDTTSTPVRSHSQGLRPLPTNAPSTRPSVRGKFLFLGDQKLFIRGVTYGPFPPDPDGSEYHTPDSVERDFALMKEHGVNAIRTYTVPPRWLLDLAWRHGLFVMVGVPWEQHITFLDDTSRITDIEERVRNGVRACARHPAILCYVVGNEIPASIVRWHGRQQVARFLQRLYSAAKEEDPEGLVTYVNFPTTEYLQLPFVDFVCFNVYLETEDAFHSYLARLQNLAGDRPLVMAEIGLDSRRNGLDVQAETLDWQIRTAFASGCAGAFVFAWTDEWYRGNHEIDDWDFGLTNRQRAPKPALLTTKNAFSDVPFPPDTDWPRVSVIICTYNGAATIREGLDALQQLQYPDYEVIVVDDGSTDETASIVHAYDVRSIETPNRGLSAARNTGLEAATGEIVVYLDDDAYPDPHWLLYVASTFRNTDHAAVGGPNIAPPDEDLVARCIDHTPGNPVHALLSDLEAEHLPGCNIAFRKTALEAIGGFDPQFRIAGDDVDVCWRLQQRGWTLGFHPAAMVWHHRRGSIRAFWKQQRNYGKAEALLEMKWPEKYNLYGHVPWRGRIYNKGSLLWSTLFQRSRIYYGTWGTGLFQFIYTPSQNPLQVLFAMPEWYLIVSALCVLALMGFLWSPLVLTVPILTAAVVLPLAQAGLHTTRTGAVHSMESAIRKSAFVGLTTALHVMQPLARLLGRLEYGLTPWRTRHDHNLVLPWKRTRAIWSEEWRGPREWLHELEDLLQRETATVRRGGNFDRWDLEVGGGVFGGIRLQMAIEEHGAGKQMARFRLWPRCSMAVPLIAILFAGLGVGASLGGSWIVSVVLILTALLLALRILGDCASAMAVGLLALNELEA